MANLKRTREDILAAVSELIHRQGMQATGLKELFEASHASSGSFYNYFPSKDKLAHALIDFKWEQIKTSVVNPAKTIAPDAIAGLLWMIDQLEAKHLAEPECAGCFLGNLIVDLVERDASFRTHLIQVFNEWQAEIAHLLHQGRSRLHPHINPDQLAEQLMDTLEGVLLMGRLYNDPDRLKRGFASLRTLVRSACQD